MVIIDLTNQGSELFGSELFGFFGLAARDKIKLARGVMYIIPWRKQCYTLTRVQTQKCICSMNN